MRCGWPIASLVNMSDLVILTGAGGGLGRHLAHQLVLRGATVVGIGRNEDSLAQTKALAGDQFHPVTGDVGIPDDMRAAFDQADKLGMITTVINNAAVYPRRDFLDETPESFAESVNANLGGTVTCSRLGLDRFIQTGQGRILNVATFADIAPLPASSAYSVSKGAARILTRALVADLGDRFPGIVITDWLPGMLQTTMGISDGIDPAQAAEWGAELALWRDASLNGQTWEMDRELPPHRGLKARIKDKVLMRKVATRRVGQGTGAS